MPPTKSFPLPAVLIERARGELQRIRQVAARIRKIFESARAVRVVEVFGILRIDQRRLLLHLQRLALADAMFSVKSTVCFWPSCAGTALFRCASKCSASALTE